ncbi:CSN12 Protein CSN12 [Candida maltosa Xu316]|uniref:Uncharacterized protein n=1 Tax=Candida maltosa (strain Xu316) TaxID=1245528 RepID=M3INF5_CANMX|nr:hypothetical protein G210_1586 [Candida maltosa Xu316]
MTELIDYIATFAKALKEEDVNTFRSCITINPSLSIANIRKEYREPTDVDLYHVPEKFRPVLLSHLKLMKAVYTEKSLNLAFDELNDLILNLIRASDFQSNWINKPLITSFNELIAIYQTKEAKDPEDLDSFIDDDSEVFDGGQAKKSSLETLVTTFRKGFNLSFNDKNPDPTKTKLNEIYYFLSNLVKYCFKLGKLNMADSIIKAVKQAGERLPPFTSSVRNKKYGIVYLYYRSLIELDNGDYIESEKSLETALDLIKDYPNTKSKQLSQILLVLIPLKLQNHGKMPSKKVWLKYPLLRVIYRDNFFKAIKLGDIGLFEESMAKFQHVLLKKHLYTLIESLKPWVYFQLIKKTFDICYEINPVADKKHMIKSSTFQLAIEYSKYHLRHKEDFRFAQDHLYNTNLNEVEYIIGNLMQLGKIKGYIHSSRLVVFSKTREQAFPITNEKKKKKSPIG